jgi:hypothetical protein
MTTSRWWKVGFGCERCWKISLRAGSVNEARGVFVRWIGGARRLSDYEILWGKFRVEPL